MIKNNNFIALKCNFNEEWEILSRNTKSSVQCLIKRQISVYQSEKRNLSTHMKMIGTMLATIHGDIKSSIKETTCLAPIFVNAFSIA